MSDKFGVFCRDDLHGIETETFVNRVEFHSELASTNDLALELATRDDVALPLLVLAERQTAGRGRGANQWWSARGALTFSVLLETESLELPPDRWPRAALAAGLAVCDTLRASFPESDIGLKWPNDVFLAGRKTCGILVETLPGRRNRLVIGIGVNVNNSFATAPAELQAIATSLFDVTQQFTDLTDVLTRILQSLETRLRMLARDDPQLSRDWQSTSLLRGRIVHLDSGPRRVVGTCHGIAPDGSLVLETERGRESFFAGVVTRFE